MAGLRNQVLILEDDPTLMNALKEAFSREGFVAHATSRPAEAREILDKHPIGTLFIDCLLPEMSGVDFVESLRPRFPDTILDVILMSGILTDPSFVKESLRTTTGKHFLRKPFPLKEALSLVEKPVSLAPEPEETPHPRKALYQLFSKGKVSPREKRRAIDALDEIHGFDLPIIYSILVESKATGHLNIAVTGGEVFGVSFAQGAIVAVDIPDKETYLGRLLMDEGYLLPEDLDKVTSEAMTSGKKLGERLLQGHLISPHALDIALALQMNIRLSRTILDQKVNVNFSEDEVPLTTPAIDSQDFTHFLHDWIASKITSVWLKAHFTPWAQCPLVKTPNYVEGHPVLSKPLVVNLKNVVEVLTSGKTLSQILDSQVFAEEPLYKALHLLLTKGLICFAARASVETTADRFKALKKMYAQLHGRNKIEMFDLFVQMTGVTDSDPDFVIQEFGRLLGPAPKPESREIFTLHSQLLTLAQQAYDFIKAGHRDRLRDELAKGDVELKLKAASNFEEAKNLLQKSQFKQALEILKKCLSVDATLEKIRLYLIWCKLGLLELSQDRESSVIELELDLVQIPPEERFDSLFHFVQGLLQKAKKDYVGARRYFEKAIAIDSNMIVARRELSVLASLAEQNKDVFNRDLKDIVGSFFRRK